MKLRTVEAYERFRAANQPSIDAAARVRETARRLQEFEKQLQVIQRAQEEERSILAAREEDLRRAQAARDAFLSQFSDEDQKKLVEGRRPPKTVTPTEEEKKTETDEARVALAYRSGKITQSQLVRMTEWVRSGMTYAEAVQKLGQTSGSIFRWDSARGVAVPER